MSLVAEVKQLLIGAALDGVDNVYANFIPSAVQLDNQTTDILITDVTDSYSGYGSNRSTEKRSTVALNITYSTVTKVDDGFLEDTITDLFEAADWTCVYSPGHTADPDTGQLTKIMQFAKTFERNVK